VIFGLKSAPDDRDFPYRSRRPGVLGLPPPRQIDRSGALPPVWDQGPEGSCTAQAGMAKLYELYPGFVGSRLAAWWVARKFEGTLGQNVGVETRTMLKVLQAGVIPEEVWAYDLVHANDAPPPVSDRRFIGSYSRLRGAAALIDHLAHDGSVIFSIDLPDSFMEDGTFPDTLERHDRWHEVLAVGYDLDLGDLLVRNSWGEAWGPMGNGHFWCPITWATDAMVGDDLWSASAAPAGTVAGVLLEAA